MRNHLLGGVAAASMAGVLALAACSSSHDSASASAETTAASATDDGDLVNVPTADDALAANTGASSVDDSDWSEDDAVDYDGGTITEAGVYRISGDVTETVTVEAADDARVVRIPVMRWTALMPTLAIVRAPGVGDPPVAPYHDLRVLTAAARGESTVELTRPTPEAVWAAREESLRQLRVRQDAHHALDVASILDAAGPNAVHVINHPGNGVLTEVAAAILAEAGLSATVPDPGRVLLGGIRAPIYASTLEALGHDPDDLIGGPHDDWIIHGEHIPEQDIAAEHLRWYARNPSVVTAGLARHEQLISRLGLDGGLRR